MSLPSYQEAVRAQDIKSAGNLLPFVLQYLDAKSLKAICLVRKSWCKYALPELWSDPIKITATASKPFRMLYPFLERS
jgi:hypothetical protein